MHTVTLLPLSFLATLACCAATEEITPLPWPAEAIEPDRFGMVLGVYEPPMNAWPGAAAKAGGVDMSQSLVSFVYPDTVFTIQIPRPDYRTLRTAMEGEEGGLKPRPLRSPPPRGRACGHFAPHSTSPCAAGIA